MEPRGIDQVCTEKPMELLPQAEHPSSCPTKTSVDARRKATFALVLTASLLLVGGGVFRLHQISDTLDLGGKTRKAGQSRVGGIADRLSKGSSLFTTSGRTSPGHLEPGSTTKMSGAPLSLPLFFEANRGQTDARVKFLVRSSGYSLLVTPTETIFASAHTAAPLGMLSPGNVEPANQRNRT